MQDGRRTDSFALHVNGFTLDEIYNGQKLSVAELLSGFLAWAKEYNITILGGHNIAFDIAFLKNAFVHAQLKWPFGYRSVDLHSIAYFYYLVKQEMPDRISLDSILDSMEMQRTSAIHNALEDAVLENKALLSFVTQMRK